MRSSGSQRQDQGFQSERDEARDRYIERNNIFFDYLKTSALASMFKILSIFWSISEF